MAKSRADNYVKVGNIYFHRTEVKKMTEKQFNDTYSKVLRGCTIESACKELGIKPKK